MKFFLAPALLLLTTAACADGHFERTLNVSSTPDLYVSNGSGTISIHAGSASQIHVSAHIRPGWSLFGGPDDARIQSIENDPPVVQQGNTVRIGLPTDSDARVRERYNNLSIDYDITAPVGVALNLRSGSGDLNTDGVGRFLNAVTGSGNIRAEGISGPAELRSGSGDITVDERSAGDIKAQTGSGGIHIHGLNGTLSARAGSGDIDAEGHLSGAAELASGSGNVRLRLGADAHFNLEASTGSGDIHVHYPGAPQPGDNSRHHVTAPINGGGPALQVRTGSGNIDIVS
jgi:hypothetical protein